METRHLQHAFVTQAHDQRLGQFEEIVVVGEIAQHLRMDQQRGFGLALVGRVTKTDGSVVTVDIGHQPGDPVLRVECDPGTLSATALFPFGLKLDLRHRPASNLWEGRFLVPEGFPDGRYAVRILIRDSSGARLSETKHFVLDGRAPLIRPDLPGVARAGEAVRVTVRTDEDVVLLTARVGDAPPIPLRWDASAKRSVGWLRLPGRLSGVQEVLFEAVDGAKNHGFARATLEGRQ